MSVSLEMPAQTHAADTGEPSAQGRLLLRVLAVLDREQVPYCLLHGYEKYPRTISGDVDLLISRQFMPERLAQILYAYREELGARVVQWFEDGAHFIVLAARGEDAAPLLLQIHVATRYTMAGRVFFAAMSFFKPANSTDNSGFPRRRWNLPAYWPIAWRRPI